MFLEILHINGRYDPVTQQHTPFEGTSRVLPNIQRAAEETVASGGDVLYRMNLNGNLYTVGCNPEQLAKRL